MAMTATTKAIVIIFLSMRVRTELDVLKGGVLKGLLVMVSI